MFFEAVSGMPWNHIAAGVVWSVALGFAIGNYACSLVHRLPRGRLLLDKTPYCGSCMTLLQTKDLFPVLSAVSLRHRCRYCGTKFPTSHTWTELLVGALFALAFARYNFSEQYVMVIAIGVFLITLAAIEANEKMVMMKVLLLAAVFGMVNRVLVDGSIYGFIGGGFYGLIIGAVLFYKGIKPVAHVFKLPLPAELIAIGGIIAGADRLPIFLAAFAVLYVLFWLLGKARGTGVTLTVPFGLAVMLPVLYPELSLSVAALATLP